MLTMTLAEKLEALREGRSNPEIAKACQCSPENIRKIAREGSQPNFALGVRLAKALGVPADWLGDDSQKMPPPRSQEQQAADVIRQVLAGGGLAGELSADERRIVAGFRSLDDRGRQRLMGHISGFIAASDLSGVATLGEVSGASEAQQQAVSEREIEAEIGAQELRRAAGKEGSSGRAATQRGEGRERRAADRRRRAQGA